MQFDQKRRKFITLLGGAAAAWPLATRAELQPRMLRVGFVGMQPRESPLYANFLKRMAELGYLEGRNFTFDYIQTPDIEGYEKKTTASSRRARLTCSWRSGTSRRCVPRSRLRTGGRSRFWPSILILWRRDMWRVSHTPEAMLPAFSYASSNLPPNAPRSLARRSRARLSSESHLTRFRESNAGGNKAARVRADRNREPS